MFNFDREICLIPENTASSLRKKITLIPPKEAFEFICFAVFTILFKRANRRSPTILISSIIKYLTWRHSFSSFASPGRNVHVGFFLEMLRLSSKNEWIVSPSISAAAAAIDVGANLRSIFLLFVTWKYSVITRIDWDFPVPPQPGTHISNWLSLAPKRLWLMLISRKKIKETHTGVNWTVTI